jgi:hypothetical protein
MSAERAVPEFRGRTVLILTLVGIVALVALAVAAVFAGDFRGGQDPRAHALSRSAVGYAASGVLMEALGAPVVISRTRLRSADDALLVLTPDATTTAEQLAQFPRSGGTLIVLPKWQVSSNPLNPGAVEKVAPLPAGGQYTPLLAAYARRTVLRQEPTNAMARVHFARKPQTRFPTGRIDRLQTVAGEGWIPVMVDGAGRAVLAQSATRPTVWLLAEPDLLNNHGLASRDNARLAGLLLDLGRHDGPVIFDVTLAGYERERGIGRTLLTPPWLAATLCALAAAVLMGLHALASFGPTRRAGRAFSPGAAALVDNSAGLVRMARKEGELAPAYAALVQARIAAALGPHADAAWLEELAARRGLSLPSDLAAEAAAAKSRHDVLSVGRKLFHWRSEMTRDRR